MSAGRLAAALAGALCLAAIVPSPARPQSPSETTFEVGAIAIRLPADWVVRRQPDGRIAIVEPGPGRWSLSFDWEQYDLPADRPPPDSLAPAAARLAGQVASRLGGSVDAVERADGEQAVIHDYDVRERGGFATVRAWHRLALRDGKFVIAHFVFSAAAGAAEAPEVAAARERIGRAALESELRPPRR
jgi:hypothetical protein